MDPTGAFKHILLGLLLCACGTHGTTCGPGFFFGTVAVQSSLLCTSQASSGPVCEVTFTGLVAAPRITIEIAHSDFADSSEHVSKVTAGGQAMGGRYLDYYDSNLDGNCAVMTKILDAATVPTGAVSAAGALVVRIETSSSVGGISCLGHAGATLVAKVSITYDELGCVPCAPGQYKLATGSGACTDCSAGSNSPQGATSCRSTTCGPGLFYGTRQSSLLCTSQALSGPTCEVTFVVLAASASPRITIKIAHSDFAASYEYVSKVTVGGQALGGHYLDYDDNNLAFNCAVMTKIVDAVTVPAGAVSAAGELVVRIETSSSVGVGCSYSSGHHSATLVANVSITFEPECVPCALGQYKAATGSGVCTDCGTGSYSRELGATACGSCGEAGGATLPGQMACSCKAGFSPVVTLPPALCTSTTTKGPACKVVFSSVSLALSLRITIEVVHSRLDFYSLEKYVSEVTVGGLALGERYLEGEVGSGRYYSNADSSQCDMMTKLVDAATVPTGAVSVVGELVVWIRTSPDVGVHKCDESSYFTGATLVVNVSLSYVAECAACTAGQYKERTGSDPCTVCKAGTSSPPGAISATQCGLCPSGKYARAGSLTCAACDAGMSASQPHSSAGATACQTCNLGEYSASESAECTICSSGKYSSSPCHEPVTRNDGRDCGLSYYYYGETCTCQDPNYLGSDGCASCPWGSSSPAASFEAIHCHITELAIFGIAIIVLAVPAGIAILFYLLQREKAISIYRFFIPPRTASVDWRQEQIDLTGMLQGRGRAGGGEGESAPDAEVSIRLPAANRSACGSVYKYEHLDFTGVLSGPGGGEAGPWGGGRGGGGGIISACGSAYRYTPMQFPGAMEGDGGMGSEGGSEGLGANAERGAGVGELGRLGGGAGGAAAAMHNYEGSQAVGQTNVLWAGPRLINS